MWNNPTTLGSMIVTLNEQSSVPDSRMHRMCSVKLRSFKLGTTVIKHAVSSAYVAQILRCFHDITMPFVLLIVRERVDMYSSSLLVLSRNEAIVMVEITAKGVSTQIKGSGHVTQVTCRLPNRMRGRSTGMLLVRLCGTN